MSVKFPGPACLPSETYPFLTASELSLRVPSAMWNAI